MTQEYKFGDVDNFAQKLFEAFDAVKSDGFQLTDDADELTAVLMAIPPAANEFGDTDAAISHLISALSRRLGDRLVDKPTE